MELTDFLLARIADDARLALGVMSAEDDASAGAAAPYGYGDAAVLSEAEKAHMVRWDPARVLAECGAKRRIVERYQRAQAAVDTDQRRVDAGGYSDERGTVGGWGVSELRPVLQLLALPFADHPDYDAGWRP